MRDAITFKKKTIILLITVAIVVIVGGFYIFKNSNDVLASTDVFKDIDFNTKDAKVNGFKFHFRDRTVEEPGTIFYAYDEDLQDILGALKEAKFTPVDKAVFSDSEVEVEYFVDVTLNKLYDLEIDSKLHLLAFSEESDSANGHLYYRVTEADNFFTLLDTLVEKALAE